MSANKDGGPAFPFVSHGGVHEHQACLPGMTLRDYFAAKAMPHLIGFCLDRNGSWGPQNVAVHAYELADAMLAEREAQP